MKNKGSVILDVWKKKSGISVNANIRFDSELNEVLKFYVADSFTIDEITDGKNSVDFSYIVKELEFRPLTKEIEILPSGLKELFLSYHGEVIGYDSLNEEDILTLNFYTAWYPTNASIEMNYLVRVHIDDSFYVVNGEYDSTQKLWKYEPLDFDVNIIALRNHEVLESKYVSVYYYDKKNDLAVYPYYENFNRIVNYYVELFGNSKADKTNIVILPKGNKNAGYLRKSLIVFGGIGDDYDENIHSLAHEVAHSWCQGASCDSWEDWLNETFAEWSALLYELEVTHNINKFNEVIAEKENDRPILKPLKTTDNSRPEGVHDYGVLYLYKMYSTYGKEAIKQILRAFDALEIKTTENLIVELNKNVKTVVLADYISDIINIR